MEGVLIGTDHHGHFLEGVSPASELCPVHTILIAATVVPTPVPHAVQVGVGTGIVPPTAFLVVGTVTWRGKINSFFSQSNSVSSTNTNFNINLSTFGLVLWASHQCPHHLFLFFIGIFHFIAFRATLGF